MISDPRLALDRARTSALPLHANPAKNSGGTHFGGIDYTESEEADKNYFLKKILAIFLGNRTSDDSRPPVRKPWRRDQVVGVQDSKVQDDTIRLIAALLRDGLVVGGFDLVVDYPSPEAISRQTCPAEAFLTAGGL